MTLDLLNGLIVNFNQNREPVAPAVVISQESPVVEPACVSSDNTEGNKKKAYKKKKVTGGKNKRKKNVKQSRKNKKRANKNKKNKQRKKQLARQRKIDRDNRRFLSFISKKDEEQSTKSKKNKEEKKPVVVKAKPVTCELVEYYPEAKPVTNSLIEHYPEAKPVTCELIEYEPVVEEEDEIITVVLFKRQEKPIFVENLFYESNLKLLEATPAPKLKLSEIFNF